MWQRFTERARKVVFYAQEEAGAVGENYVSTEHLLLGLIREDDSFTARLLDRIGISREDIRSEVERQVFRGEGRPGQDMQLTPAAKKVIDLAYSEAKRLRNNYIGGEHLLLGLLAQGEGLAARVLTGLGMTVEATREQVQQMQDKKPAPDEAPQPRPGMEGLYAKVSEMLGTNDDRRLEEAQRQEELFSFDEAVKFLGTSKPTLYRLLGQDEIKGLKVGRQWRFRKADLIAYLERRPVAVAAAPREDLKEALAFLEHEMTASDREVNDDEEMMIGTIARQILRHALDLRASDIHLEPDAEALRVRLRVDGVLQEAMTMPSSLRESLTAQFKTMAEMDVSEKRLPQNGRIPLRHEGKDFTVRVSSVPSIYGESIAMRVLAKQDFLVALDSLALAPNDLAQVRALLRRPSGLFLAAGPTGSGKRSLLYSCLQDTAGGEKKTVTIEDPIEYILPHVTQVQVNKKAGLTFAAGLRSLLGQDPDVILVGEMRDGETAALAAEAALGGHLVLTALQAGDAPSALLRLMDLGLPPHLVTSTVVGVVGMRLCRRLCDHCKAPADIADEPTQSHVIRLAREGGYDAPPSAVFHRGRGCERCRGRGYAGLVALYEVMTMSSTVAEALLRRASAEELTALAVADGMRTLLADGIRKAVDGQTTVEEVLRVVSVSA